MKRGFCIARKFGRPPRSSSEADVVVLTDPEAARNHKATARWDVGSYVTVKVLRSDSRADGQGWKNILSRRGAEGLLLLFLLFLLLLLLLLPLQIDFLPTNVWIKANKLYSCLSLCLYVYIYICTYVCVFICRDAIHTAGGQCSRVSHICLNINSIMSIGVGSVLAGWDCYLSCSFFIRGPANSGKKKQNNCNLFFTNICVSWKVFFLVFRSWHYVYIAIRFCCFCCFFIFAQGTFFFKQLCVYTCIIYIIILQHFDDILGSSLKKKKSLFAPNQ